MATQDGRVVSHVTYVKFSTATAFDLGMGWDMISIDCIIGIEPPF